MAKPFLSPDSHCLAHIMHTHCPRAGEEILVEKKYGRYAQIRSCKVGTESQAENSHGSILLGAAHWVHIWPPTINKSTPSQIQCLILGIQGSVLNDTILSKLVHIIRMLNKGLAVYILNIQLYPSVGPPEALQPAT